MSKLLAVGTVAFDAIETPFGKTDKILGGSGTFVGLAASVNLGCKREWFLLLVEIFLQPIWK